MPLLVTVTVPPLTVHTCHRSLTPAGMTTVEYRVEPT